MLNMEYMPASVKAAFDASKGSDNRIDFAKLYEGLKLATPIEPQDPEYISVALVQALFYVKKYAEGAALGREILPTLTIDECIKTAYQWLEANVKAKGDEEETIALLEILAEKPYDRGNALNDLREIYAKRKDKRNTMKYGLLLDADESADTEVYEQLAQLYEEEGNYLESFNWLVKAGQSAFDTCQLHWMNAGRALALAGKQDEAMFYFKMALALSPGETWVHFYMGQIYQDKGESYMAMHHYTEALKLKPDFAEVYNNLACISFNEDSDIKGAIENLEKALTLNPSEEFKMKLYLNLINMNKTISDYDRLHHYQKLFVEGAGFSYEESDEEDGDDAGFELE